MRPNWNNGSVSQWGRQFHVVGSGASPLSLESIYIGNDGLVCNNIIENRCLSTKGSSLRPTGDLDLIIRLSCNDWTPSSMYNSIVTHGRLNDWANVNYSLQLNTNGTLLFYRHSTSLRSFTSTVATGFSDGSYKWLRVTFDQDNGSSQSEVKFYTADDSSTVPTVWTQLGSTVTSADVGAGRTAVQDLWIGSGYASNSLGDTGMYGVIKRLIIKDGIGGTTIFDADFDAQTAGTMAFVESSATAATVYIDYTTRYNFGFPNVEWTASNVTQALVANNVYYRPFLVTAPIIVDGTVFAVATGPGSAANVRTGIYRADGSMQPSGGPLLDSGNVAVGSGVTGTFFTQVSPLYLEPGIYLSAINSSVAMTLRAQRGGITSTNPLIGASSVELLSYASQTQGAFPNPGTLWNRRTYGSSAPNHVLFLRYESA